MSPSSKCLGCYELLEGTDNSESYHGKCSRKLFGTDRPPFVNFGIDQLEEMAKFSLSRHLGITGVQQKVSVDLEKHQEDPSHRLMISGLWGNFILKPPTKRFHELSVVEDATMHMASAAGIVTARHGLIRLQTGELAYVTKRFDREKKKKISMEDFCQLSELLTADKYDTSSENAGKIIHRYSSQPGLDAVSFFDLHLFSFLTGNADMHLKNFSLLRNKSGEMELSPAYDLLATKLLIPKDKEEMALTINGKKIKLKKIDFVILGRSLKMNEKSIENSFLRLQKSIPEMKRVIAKSFLSNSLKKVYLELLTHRAQALGMKVS